MIDEEFKRAMLEAGFSMEQTRKAIHCFDSVLSNYTISKNEANIVTYDSVNINRRYLELYLQCRKFEGMSNNTLKNHGLFIGKYIDSLNCSVLDAGTMHIRNFLFKFQNNGWCNNSLDKLKSYISAFYAWLIKEKQTTYNPCSALPKLKDAFKYQGYLTPEELRYIKFACTNLTESLLIEFLVSTGCRIAEFVSIKLGDLDMEKMSVVILGKGNKERKIYFSSEAKILITKLYGDNPNKDTYLFGCQRKGKLLGTRVTTSTARGCLKDIVARVKEHIKLEKVTPHTMRRTFATSLLNKGVPLEIVSKLLGHNNISTTMRYIYIGEETLSSTHHKFVA